MGFIGLCLLAGMVDAVAARAGLRGWFAALPDPWLRPPRWVLPAAWSVVYLSMAVAAWLIWRVAGVARRKHYSGLRLWGWQLLVNALWVPLFFQAHDLRAAFAMLLAGGVLAVLTTVRFYALLRPAGLLMVPSVVWVAYSLVLNGLIVLGA